MKQQHRVQDKGKRMRMYVQLYQIMSPALHKEVSAIITCGVAKDYRHEGRSPLSNGLIQTQGVPLFHSISPLASFLTPSFPLCLIFPFPRWSFIFLYVPPLSFVLPWHGLFTSDPIPTILIETKSHYGGLLFLPACICAFVPTFYVGGGVYLHIQEYAVPFICIYLIDHCKGGGGEYLFCFWDVDLVLWMLSDWLQYLSAYVRFCFYFIWSYCLANGLVAKRQAKW